MIRFLVRWAFRLFVLAVVLGVALVLLKDVLAKSLLEARIRSQTGLEVRIGKLEVGLLSPSLTLETVRLYNAPEFGGSPFLDIPDLHVLYDPAALLQRRLHLQLLRLSLAEVNIVESKNGRTNLVLGLTDLEPVPALAPTEREMIFGLQFAGIETLNLTFGKITYSSLRRPGRQTEAKIGLKNEIFTGINSLPQLHQILMNALFRNGITISTEGGADRGNAGPKPREAARPAVKSKPR